MGFGQLAKLAKQNLYVTCKASALFLLLTLGHRAQLGFPIDSLVNWRTKVANDLASLNRVECAQLQVSALCFRGLGESHGSEKANAFTSYR